VQLSVKTCCAVVAETGSTRLERRLLGENVSLSTYHLSDTVNISILSSPKAVDSSHILFGTAAAAAAATPRHARGCTRR